MQDKLRAQKEATDKRRGYELTDGTTYALATATVSYFRELFMS